MIWRIKCIKTCNCMQNHRLIPYKFKSNMHLFLSRKDSLV
nr:MAG TPA: hypothetical protein [Caudoviricetes sp.]